jgi:hypothetical protein
MGLLVAFASASARAQNRCWDGEGRIVTSKWTCSDLGLHRAPSAAAVQAEHEQALRASQIEAGRRAVQDRATAQPPRGQRRPAQPIPGTTGPSRLVNCDGAGCWDTNGQRHNNAAGGNFHRSDGKFCQPIGGGQVICN